MNLAADLWMWVVGIWTWVSKRADGVTMFTCLCIVTSGITVILYNFAH